jgi:soluble lytic murein transglycosylase-like protein
MKSKLRAWLMLLLLPFLLGASTPTPTIERVYRWLPIVREECPDQDPLLILGIIAQESGGDPTAVREERNGRTSVGLMQIHTFDWRPSPSWLIIPRNNIRYGCSILGQILDKIQYDFHQNYTESALAIYNCGEVKVAQGTCGPYGGYYYADRILYYWVPEILSYHRDRLWERRMLLIERKLLLGYGL